MSRTDFWVYFSRKLRSRMDVISVAGRGERLWCSPARFMIKRNYIHHSSNYIYYSHTVFSHNSITFMVLADYLTEISELAIVLVIDLQFLNNWPGLLYFLKINQFSLNIFNAKSLTSCSYPSYYHFFIFHSQTFISPYNNLLLPLKGHERSLSLLLLILQWYDFTTNPLENSHS